MLRRPALALFVLLAACGGGGGDGPMEADVGAPATFRSADLLFGQTAFTGHLRNRGSAKPEADSLNGPGFMAPSLGGDGLLYLPDIGNHRVLGFFETPVFNNLAANFVIGQPGFEYSDANVGATALSSPVCARTDEFRLCVSDFGNNRVVVWDSLPISDAFPASRVLGQTDFTSRASATSATGMNGPLGIAFAQERLLVADSGNNRVLLWNAVPESDGAPADLVLGQADFTSGAANRGGVPSAATLSEPFAIWSDGERIAVVDRGNHRVLVWRTWPTENGTPADFVLGQASFDAAEGRLGADGMRAPTDVSSDGGRLLVADGGNNRILTWSMFPDETAQPADGLLGQGRFDIGAANDDDQDGVSDAGPSARTLSSGSAGILTVCVAGVKIFVGDTGNNRMLIYLEE